MKTNNSKTKTKAFLGAALMLLIALLFTACPQRAKPKPKHAVTFSVDGTGGMLKAKADGVDETSTSPINVEEGKAVIFTATADAGYRVKGWTLDGNAVNGTAETYTLAVTKTTTVSVSFEVTSVEGGAVLILSPNKLTIDVKAKTEDGSDITVEGCTETTLASGTKTTLTATGTTVILKGNITELHCSDNKLTSLNVQGLTALQKLSCGGNKLTALNVQGLKFLKDLNCSSNKLTELNVQGCTALEYLWCSGNQLNAKAMTELLNALPARTAGDDAEAILYFEWTGFTEGNCKDFTNPPELKAAFDGAKKRNWRLKKINANGDWVDI